MSAVQGKTKCSGLFSLRTGTSTIAVLELIATALLLWGLRSALNNNSAVYDELEDWYRALTHEIDVYCSDKFEHGSWPCWGRVAAMRFYVAAGEEMITILLATTAFYVLHFLSCLLLLFGSLLSCRSMLLPWLATKIASLLLAAFAVAFLILGCPIREYVLLAVVALFIGVGIQSYWWKIVVRYYQDNERSTLSSNKLDSIIFTVEDQSQLSKSCDNLDKKMLTYAKNQTKSVAARSYFWNVIKET